MSLLRGTKDPVRHAERRAVQVLPDGPAHCPVERCDQLFDQVLSEIGVLRRDHPQASGQFSGTALAGLTLVDREVDVSVVELPDISHESS
jgi:hypothetical protein